LAVLTISPIAINEETDPYPLLLTITQTRYISMLRCGDCGKSFYDVILSFCKIPHIARAESSPAFWGSPFSPVVVLWLLVFSL